MRGMNGPTFLGLGLRGICWVVPSQIGIKSPSNNLRNGEIFLLTLLINTFLLLLSDIEGDSFFGHLSHPFLTFSTIMLYDNSISERREQGACWSTSTSWMAASNNMRRSTRPSALSSSFATSVCVCGWMGAASPKT